MTHKLRKVRRQRGSRTHGYGRVGQHRKKGSKGVRKAGRHKHLWSYVITKEPDYFKKGGFTSPKSLGREFNTINVGELDELAEKIIYEKNVRGKTEIVINLKELGYDKLLGQGRVTKPTHVKVQFCSETAARKVEDAGGQVLVEKSS